MNPKIIRYIVQNPDEAIPASYNAGLGQKQALSYAIINARQNRGQIIAENIDSTTSVIEDFSRKN